MLLDVNHAVPLELCDQLLMSYPFVRTTACGSSQAAVVRKDLFDTANHPHPPSAGRREICARLVNPGILPAKPAMSGFASGSRSSDRSVRCAIGCQHFFSDVYPWRSTVEGSVVIRRIAQPQHKQAFAPSCAVAAAACAATA